MRLFSCKENLENAVFMYHYFIYILHCGFLFWVFQFLCVFFFAISTAVKSKPDFPPPLPQQTHYCKNGLRFSDLGKNLFSGRTFYQFST